MITRRARAGRATLLASVPLLALATLAAGCGTVTTPSAGSAAGAAGTHSSANGPAKGAPAAPATPVPTTTGGPINPGVPACDGWPAKAPHEQMPASFVPVAVLRCVSADQAVPGKGQWLTETMERADSGLGQLITALRMPNAGHAPGTMCPDIAMLPPQIVLVGSDGTKISPRLPLSGCGQVRTQVLGALSVLTWKPVSVRMVTQIKAAAAAKPLN